MLSGHYIPLHSNETARSAGAEIRGYVDIGRRDDRASRRVYLQGSHIIVGRNPTAQVVLDHTTVSRAHAELVHDPFGRWWVHDLGSTNGTRVNGTPVQERVLNPGDWLEIGEFVLQLFTPATRPKIDSGFPVAPPEGQAPQVEEPTHITLMPRDGEVAPQISAAHLSTVMALGRRLVGIEDPVARLEAICSFAVGEGFPGEVAMAVNVREGVAPRLTLGPYRRAESTADPTPYLSRTVLDTLLVCPEPLLASSEPFLRSGVRRLSMSGGLRHRAIIACPLRVESDKLTALHVEVLPKYGSVEWLALLALACEAYAQAELTWEIRRAERSHALVEQELQMARQLQQRLLPQDLKPAGLDLAIGFEPCRWVGGDYVDVVPMPDGRVMLIVADVCGKGLQAALVASSLHTMVRATMDAGGSLRQLTQRLNAYLCTYLPEHSFVTMVAVAIDTATGALEYINAGHPPALVVDAKGMVRQLPSEVNLALGMLATPSVELQTASLLPSETLLLYTDGLTDGMSSGGHSLGVDHVAACFSRLVRSGHHETSAQLRDRLMDALKGLHRTQLAIDDTAFLVARRQP